MASIWLESLGRSFEEALDMLAAAVRNCPDELWETPMWQVRAWDPDLQLVTPDGKPVTDPYIDKPVRFDNMAIFPGSTIVLDDNPLSIASYLDEYEEVS